MPGFWKTREELLVILDRLEAKGARSASLACPDVAGIDKDESRREAMRAIRYAALENRGGRPLLPPAGWFPPPS